MASVLVPLALFVFAALESRHQLFADAEEMVRANAAILREHALKVFETQELVLHEIEARLAGRDLAEIGGATDLHQVLVGIVANLEQIHSIWIVDADGDVLLSSLSHPVPAINIADVDYFQEHRAADRGTLVSKTYVGQLSRERVYNLSHRIPSPDGGFGGIVVVTSSPAYFANYYAGFLQTPDQSVMLVRTDGEVLARIPTVEGAASTVSPDSPLFQALARSPDGIYLARSRVDGMERMVGYRKVGEYPVVVGYALTTASILGAWYRIVGTYGLLTVLAIAALSLTTLSALRRTRDALDLQAMLRRSNEVLERRVEERTVDLSAANANLQGVNDALRQAVAERELLLREIHHRVKNNLQVIISLLNLQAHSVGPALIDAFNESLRRIRTMARIHELIYSSDNITGLNFAAYLDQLCSELITFYGIADRVSCRVEAEPLRFDLDTATPMAMIVNEVLSNACKHAFPDGATGMVSLGLVREDGRVVLSVADNGIGVSPDFKDQTHPSMGMRLVRTLSDRLDAEYSFGPGEGGQGTIFRLAFDYPAETGRQA